VPLTDGVPLIVIVLLDHEAVTPDGKSTGTPIPVAPVVVCVMLVNVVLIHNVGVALAELTVLFGVTIIVPVAFTLPHPPVNGIL
jgi:hypothetical protein